MELSTKQKYYIATNSSVMKTCLSTIYSFFNPKKIIISFVEENE